MYRDSSSPWSTCSETGPRVDVAAGDNQTMRVLLSQHGDAVAKEVDPDRRLSDRGRLEVERVAQFLGKGSVQPSRILHSGKTRARQTAELLAEGLQCSQPIEAVSNLDPNDPIEEWIEWANGGGEDTLIVGHMPFVAKLATALVAGKGSATVVEFCPGSVLCLRKNEDSEWQVCWMIRPEIVGG